MTHTAIGLLPQILRSRGKNNTLFDINRAADFIDAALHGVKVKELVWVEGDGETADKLYFEAKSIAGTYWVIAGEWGHRETETHGMFDTDAEAFSAAEAHYNARILSALSTKLQEPVGATEITMGRGSVDVTEINHEGKRGILFRPRESVIPVGEPGELQAGEYCPVNGDVVIWIENEGGAKVIQKYLSAFLPCQPVKKAIDALEAIDAEYSITGQCKELLDEALATLAHQPVTAGWMPTHRHVKRGSEYQVVLHGRLQVDGDLDMEKVTVYQAEDGTVWVRPDYEFNDGCFAALKTEGSNDE